MIEQVEITYAGLNPWLVIEYKGNNRDLSLGDNLERALAFYDDLLATLDVKRQLDIPGVGAAYGKSGNKLGHHTFL